MKHTANHPVFHHGELAAQEKAGVPDFADKVHKTGFVRTFMPDQHREFFSGLPMISAGLLDKSGRPWATMLLGEIGFIQSPEPDSLTSTSLPIMSKTLNLEIGTGAKIGLCGVEVETRRRNRMNGTVVDTDGSPFSIHVDQSFGNCPQYIQKRELEWATIQAENNEPEDYERSPTLSSQSKSLIKAADTFFIASRASVISDDPREGVDASHRGGKPGFLNINDDNTLSFPDFSGNRFYNTIGNIEADSRMGLFIPNLTTGDAVMITGHASVSWEDKRIAAFDGAQCIIDITVEESIYIPALLPISGKLIELWPVLEETGSWQKADVNMLKREGYRTFEITRTQRESSTISSFYFKPADGGSLEDYVPGQFLPIRLEIEGEEPLLRNYTLSQAPSDSSSSNKAYRLSIKREEQGRGSQVFHDQFTLGSRFEAASPIGDFFLDKSENPIVMLSAGVGITPMIAMLDGLIKSGIQTTNPRKLWFVHGAADSEARAFDNYLSEQQQKYPWLIRYTTFSKPLAGDKIGEHYDAKGYVTIDTLKSLLPFDNYQFYLCGPEKFMQSLYASLKNTGINRANIHYEFFGDGSLGDDVDDDDSANTGTTYIEPQSALVQFAASEMEAIWTPESGSLLDLAEAQGLTPTKNCRAGKCGACKTRLISGDVYYPKKPVITPPEGHVLICCSKPKSSDAKIVLDI